MPFGTLKNHITRILRDAAGRYGRAAAGAGAAGGAVIAGPQMFDMAANASRNAYSWIRGVNGVSDMVENASPDSDESRRMRRMLSGVTKRTLQGMEEK